MKEGKENHFVNTDVLCQAYEVADHLNNVCGAQNVVTGHLSENGTKKVRSEGKIKAQLPFRVSHCLHIVYQDLTKKLGVISQ
ncbi:hypothetical protein [Asticcacaulis sp. MM231]|uniref:hypothetical protein n=1 Tax=Asticcacaulis sp. MM231 TaxID=3157666 RepID=UPI0032D59708